MGLLRHLTVKLLLRNSTHWLHILSCTCFLSKQWRYSSPICKSTCK